MLGAIIKLPCPGVLLLLNVVVVPDVLTWCPSLPRPHWYKWPYALASVLEVATRVAPRLRSIQILPVAGLVTVPGITEFEGALEAPDPLIFVATTVKV